MQAAAQEGREEAPWGAPHHPRFPVFFRVINRSLTRLSFSRQDARRANTRPHDAGEDPSFSRVHRGAQHRKRATRGEQQSSHSVHHPQQLKITPCFSQAIDAHRYASRSTKVRHSRHLPSVICSDLPLERMDALALISTYFWITSSIVDTSQAILFDGTLSRQLQHDGSWSIALAGNGRRVKGQIISIEYS